MSVFIIRIQIFRFNMVRCLVCDAPNAKFAFPDQRGILFLWMNILELANIPTRKERICCDHFNSEDVVFDGRRTQLETGALPLSGVNRLLFCNKARDLKCPH